MKKTTTFYGLLVAEILGVFCCYIVVVEECVEHTRSVSTVRMIGRFTKSLHHCHHYIAGTKREDGSVPPRLLPGRGRIKP